MRAKNEAIREELQQRKRAEAPTPEEEEAEQSATDFYAILARDKAKQSAEKTTIDSTSFCELMSEDARAQTVHYAEVSSGIAKQWDCESAVELLVLRAKGEGGFEGVQQARVLGVNVVGEKATATVRFGDGPVTSLPMVKEDGEWKLAASSVPGE